MSRTKLWNHSIVQSRPNFHNFVEVDQFQSIARSFFFVFIVFTTFNLNVESSLNQEVRNFNVRFLFYKMEFLSAFFRKSVNLNRYVNTIFLGLQLHNLIQPKVCMQVIIKLFNHLPYYRLFKVRAYVEFPIGLARNEGFPKIILNLKGFNLDIGPLRVSLVIDNYKNTYSPIT